jgi:hypothetical protein
LFRKENEILKGEQSGPTRTASRVRKFEYFEQNNRELKRVKVRIPN